MCYRVIFFLSVQRLEFFFSADCRTNLRSKLFHPFKMEVYVSLFKFQVNSSIETALFATLDEPNFFPDTEIPVWLKLSCLFGYFISWPGIFIVLAFVYYETQGYAGSFRTIINQHASWQNLLVSIKSIFLKIFVCN